MSAIKILLVQLYSNGDCLYATTVARQIKTDFPGSHLTWAIASFCKSIIANNPYVDAVLEINSVKKNDVAAFRRLRKDLHKQEKAGVYDKVFFVHNVDLNHAYYDGTIRGSILKAYPHPITVPVQPVLRLFNEEIAQAKAFVEKHMLNSYDQVVLFEYAPQSGQSSITPELAIRISEGIVGKGNYAVILSSANKITPSNKAIIDGSSLTLRETAALSHHCTFLLGSSSGITWITTSEAGKKLPMVQLLNAYVPWVNSISRDFERFQIPNKGVIELLHFDETRIVDCVCLALENFQEAKKIYGEPLPLHFKTTRSIVYNLLVYFEFGAIARHIKVNQQVYGNNPAFYKELILGFVLTPFTLIKNLVTKHF